MMTVKAKQFNVGDKVRILDVGAIEFGNRHYYNGMVTEITRIDHDSDIFLRNKKGEEGIYVGKKEQHAIELIPEKPTPKYTTEKRKANVGERILNTNAKPIGGRYKDGDVLAGKEVSRGGLFAETSKGIAGIYHEEYEVIIAERPSKNERISLLESQVAVLTAKVELLEFSKRTADTGAIIRETIAKLSKESPTPNQQRKAVIERAKAFVSEWESKCGRKVSYVINAEKRTVVALKHRMFFGIVGEVIGRGIAKCAPDDVFNADIGKAIALGRALGLDVSEFENAVKPTEVVVEMIAEHIEDGDIYSIEGIHGKFRYDMRHKDGTYYGDFDMYDSIENFYVIIDDTEAQY